MQSYTCIGYPRPTAFQSPSACSLFSVQSDSDSELEDSLEVGSSWVLCSWSSFFRRRIACLCCERALRCKRAFFFAISKAMSASSGTRLYLISALFGKTVDWESCLRVKAVAWLGAKGWGSVSQLASHLLEKNMLNLFLFPGTKWFQYTKTVKRWKVRVNQHRPENYESGPTR